MSKKGFKKDLKKKRQRYHGVAQLAAEITATDGTGKKALQVSFIYKILEGKSQSRRAELAIAEARRRLGRPERDR